MASPYDALLDAPKSNSEYDALLDSSPAGENTNFTESAQVVPFDPSTQPTISATPTFLGELGKTITDPTVKGTYEHAKEAGHIAYETLRRPLSGLLGPTESQRIEESIPFGKDAHGNVKYEYKPLGDRPTREAGLMTSFLPMEPLAHAEGDSKTKSAMKAGFNVAEGLVGSLLSPLGIALGGVGGELPQAGKAIGGLFSADMLASVPAQIEKTFTGKTLQEKIEGGLGAVMSLAMGYGGAKVALGGREPTPAEIREYTSNELAKLTPDETLLSKEPAVIDPHILDGLVLSREKLKERQAQVDQDAQARLQESVDDIDAQLLRADRRQVQASEERVRSRSQSQPQSTPESIASESAGPRTDDTVFQRLKQQQEEQQRIPQSPEVGNTDETPLPISTAEIRRIAGPALADESGKIVAKGKIGDTHAKLKFEAALRDEDLTDATHVFFDQNGNPLTREQAGPIAEAAGQRIPETKGPLQSEHLKKDELAEQKPTGSKEQSALSQVEPASVGASSEPTADDWTGATAEEPKRMNRRKSAGESGAVLVPKIKIAERRMSELDRSTAERSAKLQRSTDDGRRAQKEINKVSKSKDRQGGISLWIEANGDAAKLAAWEAGAKGEAFKKAAKAAQSLTTEEIALAKKVQASFKVLEGRGNKYDVLKNHRDNYVPHVWEVDKTKSGSSGGRLEQNFKFNKARSFENFAEGDAAGFKPKTLAIGDLLPAYLHEMNKVIADRQFVEEISKGKAKDGRPLVVPRGRFSDIETDSGGKAYLANPRASKGLKDAAGNDVDTSDYKVVENQPALHDWRWEGKDDSGSPIFMKDDLALHPEAVKRLKAMLGQSEFRKWSNEGHSGIEGAAALLFKGVDKAQSVMKREMFSMIAPFHQVQEGWHGIAHTVNPLFDIPKIDLRDAAQSDATKHGLMLLPDRTTMQQYLEGVGGQSGFVAQALRKFGSKAGESVAGVIDGYQDYLFHKYIPGLKFKTYEAITGRNMARYVDEIKSGKLTESDVKLLSAEQTNAAYGHLNYALLDRDPTFQHFLQLTLLAPDFLEARGRFVAQAAKGIIGSKTGREQLKALATIAAVQAGIAYTTTQLGGGEYDPKRPFEANVGGRSYTLRSVPEDLAALLSDSRQFVYGRINPLTVKGGTQMITGLNYRGEKTTKMETLEELLAQYIPITARSVPGVRALTETSRQSPISALEQLAGSMGVRISRKSPISDTYKLASEWMEKQGIPKDKGSYPVSKYQQLRYALEDGDLSRAGEQMDKLMRDSTRDKITLGFRESVRHPFTQSQAMDAKFRSTLEPKDRALFDLAKTKREQILQRFNLLRRK